MDLSGSKPRQGPTLQQGPGKAPTPQLGIFSVQGAYSVSKEAFSGQMWRLWCQKGAMRVYQWTFQVQRGHIQVVFGKSLVVFGVMGFC